MVVGPQRRKEGIMPSKMVTDRQKAAARLSGTVEVYSEQATDVFLSLLEPFLDEGANPPDLNYLQLLLSRRLDELSMQLVEVDEVHRSERKEDRRLRLQRDTAAEELKKLMTRLRVVIDQLYGADTCARVLDVEGRLPQDPVALHRVASRLVEGLRQGFLDEGGSLLAGVQLDVSAWISLMKEPMARLGEALDHLDRENPETGSRLMVKTSLMKEYDRAYRATASLVESLFRYVGRPELAERIRPKQRSPTAEAGDPPDSGPPETDPPIFPPDEDDAFPDDFDVPFAAI